MYDPLGDYLGDSVGADMGEWISLQTRSQALKSQIPGLAVYATPEQKAQLDQASGMLSVVLGAAASALAGVEMPILNFEAQYQSAKVKVGQVSATFNKAKPSEPLKPAAPAPAPAPAPVAAPAPAPVCVAPPPAAPSNLKKFALPVAAFLVVVVFGGKFLK